MCHPLETAFAASFERLRALSGQAETVAGQHVVPGVWVAADTRDGRFEGAVVAEPGGIVRLDMQVLTPGRWLSLNIGLDPAPLAPGTVLGLVAELSADGPPAAGALPVGAAVRSGHDGGHVDIVSSDRLEVGREPRVAVVLLHATAATVRPGPPAWRNLMLNLPQRDFRLWLRDMHLFVREPDAAVPDPAPDPVRNPARNPAGNPAGGPGGDMAGA